MLKRSAEDKRETCDVETPTCKMNDWCITLSFLFIQTLNLLACVATKVMDANLFLFVGPEVGIFK